jgi:hypothetical protein
MISSAGNEELLDMRCALGASKLTIAQMEYYKTFAYALMPFFLSICSLLAWSSPCAKWAYPAKERAAMRTGTIVLYLYLIYPSLSSRMLSLFQCEALRATSIDGSRGEDIGLQIFVADPETLCTSAEHTFWQMMVSWPGIVL